MAEPHRRELKHTALEDAQAFLLGTAMCALGLVFLKEIGLITGQTAGLGVLLSYVTGWPFGWVFFAVNLPFYLLAWFRMGAVFTVKTAIAVELVSVLAEVFPQLMRFEALDPYLGAVLAGASIGLGLIVIFRHGASLGGIGVLGLWMQEKLGIQAGWVQLGFDVALFAAAAFVLDWQLVGLSLIGAVAVNLIIAVNHRQDRYIGR
ncbi:MAG: YitT family protein [Pseudomonadota bacterium]